MVMTMEYIDVVLKHIETVKTLWQQLKWDERFPYKDNPAFVSAVDFLIENHDNSRFNDVEIEACAYNFFPEDDCFEEGSEYTYTEAVRHHNCCNPHHWEWWRENKEIMSAPAFVKHMFLCEMMCDWFADAQVSKRNIEEYYEKANDNLHFDNECNRFIFTVAKILGKT